jgi:ubiquinone/menaquinone biosynthesis C-methylase UbiE
MNIFTSFVHRYIQYPARRYSGSIESQMVLVAGKKIEDLYLEAQFDFERYAKGSLDRYFKNVSVTCLDVGCGFGRVTTYLPNCIGIDINLNLITEAKKQHVNHKFESYVLFDKYPIESSSIDYVFSYASFIHCKSFEEVRWNLSEIERVLKPGGIATLNFRIVPRGFRQTVHSYVQLNKAIFILLKWRWLVIPWVRKNCNFYGVVINEQKFGKLITKFTYLSHVSTLRNFPERIVFYTIKKDQNPSLNC